MNRHLTRLARFAPVAAAAALGLATAAQAAPESIVVFGPGVPAGAERAAVRAVGGRVTRQLSIIHALGATLTPDQAHRLAGVAGVTSVTADSRMRTTAADPAASPCTASQPLCAAALATSYIASAGVNSLWGDATSASTGTGVGVAVLDTGVDGGLPDFRLASGHGPSRVIAAVTTNPSATTTADLFGHGTHVAGILAGNGDARPVGDPQRGRYIGVAPNADLISVKASDDHGNTTETDVINALGWIVANRAAFHIKVVNLSLSASTPRSYLTDPLDAAVEQAWRHGITVVVAAGNRGRAADAVDYAPANDPYVITVGAVATQGTGAVARWSSRGITQDGYAKPDIYAPGEHIVAPLAPGSAFASLCRSCIRGAHYFQISGTSMAAPVVSGVVADLLSAHPTWTPTEVKSALLARGRLTGAGALEVAADAAAHATRGQLAAYTDAGLTPNRLVAGAGAGSGSAAAASALVGWPAAGGSSPLSVTWVKASWTAVGISAPRPALDPAASLTKAAWTAFFADTPVH